jgi:hypothetical protein
MKHFSHLPFQPLGRLLSWALLCAALTACGETDGPAAGEQFTPLNRLVRDYKHLVSINYSGTSVSVSGEGASMVSITTDADNSARLSIESDARGIAYFVTGKSTDGCLHIESTQPYALYMNNLTLSSSQGPAVDSQCDEAVYLVLCNKSTNTLSDADNYPLHYTAEGMLAEDNGCFYTRGALIFTGEGTLTVQSNASARYEATLGDTLRIHGINALGGIESAYGITLNVTATGGDGLHVEDSNIHFSLGSYTIAGARHGLCNLAGDVLQEGGTLSGTAGLSSYIYTPMGHGYQLLSGTCFAAAATPTTVLETPTQEGVALDQQQIVWQAQVDSLTLVADSTITAYAGATKIATLTVAPFIHLASPFVLVSSEQVTKESKVSVR